MRSFTESVRKGAMEMERRETSRLSHIVQPNRLGQRREQEIAAPQQAPVNFLTRCFTHSGKACDCIIRVTPPQNQHFANTQKTSIPLRPRYAARAELHLEPFEETHQ